MAQTNDPTRPPPDSWDDDLAATLAGKIVLVGLTHLSKDEQVLRREQFYGCVAAVDRRIGIRLELAGEQSGQTYVLPPDTANLTPARPGDYRLSGTGEVVTDPDYLSTWNIYPRDNA